MSIAGAQAPAPSGARPDRHFLGMPLALLGGYIAIVFCMTGDGIEQAFLSKYLVNLGFTTGQDALVFTVYGATAALSSWLSGVLADVFTPRRIMLVGVAWWLVFHCLFLWLGLGLGHPNLPLTLLFYGIRGFAYPLFFYGFFVWVVEKSRPHELASAIGWTWAMFTIGYGIVGSYLPSFTIVSLGYMGTLWMSLIWVFVGGLLIFFFTKSDPQLEHKIGDHAGTKSSKLAEISKCVTLIFHNRNIALALITRIICNLSLFGFPVIMPLFYTSPRIGFTVPQWALIWGTFFLVQPVTNVVWGLIGDRIGWMRQMRWFGFVGCGTASLALLLAPLTLSAQYDCRHDRGAPVRIHGHLVRPHGRDLPHDGAGAQGRCCLGAEPRRRTRQLRRTDARHLDSSFLGIQRGSHRLRHPLLRRRSPHPLHPRRSAQRRIDRHVGDTLTIARHACTVSSPSGRLDLRCGESALCRNISFPVVRKMSKKADGIWPPRVEMHRKWCAFG